MATDMAMEMLFVLIFLNTTQTLVQHIYTTQYYKTCILKKWVVHQSVYCYYCNY